jgi:ADP-ribosylglycohydrolase
MTDLDPIARTALCHDSLTGLSVGDALGAQYFVPGNRPDDLFAGTVPPGLWDWTDDTEMACSVVAELCERGEIDQDALAAAFAERCEPYRGYGAGAVVILHRIRTGGDWREVSRGVFGGGSMGNGAAMRVAPLGAYFADSPDRAAEQAIRSAEVTHAHPEGILGAVAVAVAASFAAGARLSGTRPEPAEILAAARPYIVDGHVARGLDRAGTLLSASVAEAAYELGNGARVIAGDTVPFTLWCAGRFLDDYPAAITACVEAGGDVDTTAAIVGGIVAAYTGGDGIPAAWRDHREPLPAWAGADHADGDGGL